MIVFWVQSEADKQAIVQDQASPFFTTTHFDGHPSVLVRASRIGELTGRSWPRWSRTRGCHARRRAARRPGSALIPGLITHSPFGPAPRDGVGPDRSRHEGARVLPGISRCQRLVGRARTWRRSPCGPKRLRISADPGRGSRRRVGRGCRTRRPLQRSAGGRARRAQVHAAGEDVQPLVAFVGLLCGSPGCECGGRICLNAWRPPGRRVRAGT